MIEAMACGTPLIAYRSGSVPEVVHDGGTGFIVEIEAEAIEAASRVARLDRRKVRERFEDRFSASQMAREYESQYRTLIAAAGIELEDAPFKLQPLGTREGDANVA
jgi:glycosyltransferase involved in cell wall biosynthesis